MKTSALIVAYIIFLSIAYLSGVAAGMYSAADREAMLYLNQQRFNQQGVR